LASAAGFSSTYFLPVPLPNFFMEKFTPYIPSHSFVDTNFSDLLHSLLASRSFYDLSFVPFYTLSHHIHDLTPPPSHPYVCASSAFSAVIQLCARSRQLPTNEFLPLGLVVAQASAASGVVTRLGNTHTHSGAGRLAPLQPHPNHIGNHLFQDDDPWPSPSSSTFYLGLLIGFTRGSAGRRKTV
jgi:hypothetical protein